MTFVSFIILVAFFTIFMFFYVSFRKLDIIHDKRMEKLQFDFISSAQKINKNSIEVKYLIPSQTILDKVMQRYRLNLFRSSHLSHKIHYSRYHIKVSKRMYFILQLRGAIGTTDYEVALRSLRELGCNRDIPK